MKKQNPYIIFSAMGFELVGVMGIAVILGKYTDEQMGWNNSALIVYSLLGLIIWFYHFVLLLKKIESRNKDENSRNGNKGHNLK